MFLKNKNDKVFCIGRNKTGTTSLEKVLKEFGFKMGNQSEGEMLIAAYREHDWDKIVKFCKSAETFQDVPFSWPYTWLFLYKTYPNAKFILTIRNEEDWYRSITSFHSKLFAGGKRVPVKEDLINANYRYPGFIWDANRAVWKTPEDDIYNKELFIANYRRHNEDILHFFKDKPNFICLDVSKKGSYKLLADFLQKEALHEEFPHLNKTNND
ncbi:sulfotransferase [Winogradskyella costae]|uniref:sulfotransferase n=1 Tax=Winogradskyella costae TaxID=2697008 RepID=UPI0015CB6E66|nr:sulfotransferase [Winogradskyella costae]